MPRRCRWPTKIHTDWNGICFNTAIMHLKLRTVAAVCATAVLCSYAHAHPGHAGHELTWDFRTGVEQTIVASVLVLGLLAARAPTRVTQAAGWAIAACGVVLFAV